MVVLFDWFDWLYCLFDFTGECNVNKFFVVSNNKVNILGRDLCKQLGIKVIFPSSVNSLDDIHSHFKDYLTESFQSNIKDTVSLDIRNDAVLIYCKPCNDDRE